MAAGGEVLPRQALPIHSGAHRLHQQLVPMHPGDVGPAAQRGPRGPLASPRLPPHAGCRTGSAPRAAPGTGRRAAEAPAPAAAGTLRMGPGPSRGRFGRFPPHVAVARSSDGISLPAAGPPPLVPLWPRATARAVPCPARSGSIANPCPGHGHTLPRVQGSARCLRPCRWGHFSSLQSCEMHLSNTRPPRFAGSRTKVLKNQGKSLGKVQWRVSLAVFAMNTAHPAPQESHPLGLTLLSAATSHCHATTEHHSSPP